MKNYFMQTIRGIAIIMVVLIHTLKYQAGNNLICEMNICIRTIVNFAVGVFIFLSGYFIKEDEVKTNPLKFYKKRFFRLLIPFLIWSLIYTVFSNIKTIKNTNIIEIVISVLLGKNGVQLYYILALIQLIVMTPIIYKIIQMNNKVLNICMMLITPIYTLVNGLWNYRYR